MRFLVLLLLAATSASAQSTGTIAGQVLEDDGVTSVIGASVRVDGTTLGAATDLDGNYRLAGVPVGTYAVTASYVGLTSQTQTGVGVAADSTRKLDFTLGIRDYRDYEGCTLEPPMFSNDAYNVRTVHADDIERMPVNR